MGYLQSVEELNLGPPKTNPSSGREGDSNPGPPDYESMRCPATRPRSPPFLSRTWAQLSYVSFSLAACLWVLLLTPGYIVLGLVLLPFFILMGIAYCVAAAIE